MRHEQRTMCRGCDNASIPLPSPNRENGVASPVAGDKVGAPILRAERYHLQETESLGIR